jgi:hypothetical protein
MARPSAVQTRDVPSTKPSKNPTQERRSPKPTVRKSVGVSFNEPNLDIRLPSHPQFKRFQELRTKVANALANRSYIRDFNRHYVPTTTVCPATLSKLTVMLEQRDRVERQLENFLDDVDQDGNPLDPRRDIESTYEDLGSQWTTLTVPCLRTMLSSSRSLVHPPQPTGRDSRGRGPAVAPQPGDHASS